MVTFGYMLLLRLKEEEARLDMQRRSLGMLQQALFKGATEAKPAGFMEWLGKFQRFSVSEG